MKPCPHLLAFVPPVPEEAARPLLAVVPRVPGHLLPFVPRFPGEAAP